MSKGPWKTSQRLALEALLERGPMTAAQLADASGQAVHEVTRRMGELRRLGRATRTLTDSGRIAIYRLS